MLARECYGRYLLVTKQIDGVIQQYSVCVSDDVAIVDEKKLVDELESVYVDTLSDYISRKYSNKKTFQILT